MTAAMTKRERVERTIAHEETDRVPLYDLLRNAAASTHFGGEELPPMATDETTIGTLNRIENLRQVAEQSLPASTNTDS